MRNKLIVSIILYIIALITYFKPAYALCSGLPMLYKPDLVVAKLEKQEVDCQSRAINNKFKTLVFLKGFWQGSFAIVSSADSDICGEPKPSNAINLSPSGQWEDQVSIPKLLSGKTYLMSLNSVGQGKYVTSSICEGFGVFEEVNGVWDIKNLFYFLLICLQPLIWLSSRLIFLIYSFLRIFNIPDVVSIVIGIIISLIFWGVIIYILIRTIKNIVRKIKTRF
jgi:hypothetical protein